ncbi:response regulator [Paenibacillus albicereus]|uniref:Response regulator n=1 Tax=Paenibacillus albicereus TaxID=2726185 RepID=A0A6H2GU75_9BACL|nr:response regulator [Paenibacillus albicereus]QJC50983.1 response regulator [Paenibacillus albicereus]
MRVLIVDDERMTRRGIQLTLERHFKGSLELELAEHGEMALLAMQERGADLLLTDVRMPGMTGVELLEELARRGLSTTSILLTGYAEFEYARAALRLGACNYLLKPLDQAKLIEAVEDGLARSLESSRMRRSMKLYDERLGDGIREGGLAPGSSSIDQACAYMEEHLADALALKEVAAAVHLSPSYFSVLFKQERGVTFSEYASRLRHRRAKELLLTTRSDILLIAEEAGYQSASYFIKVFKEREGMTPRQYREACGKP